MFLWILLFILCSLQITGHWTIQECSAQNLGYPCCPPIACFCRLPLQWQFFRYLCTSLLTLFLKQKVAPDCRIIGNRSKKCLGSYSVNVSSYYTKSVLLMILWKGQEMMLFQGISCLFVSSVSGAVTTLAGCAFYSLLWTAQLPFDPACGPPAKILA